MVGTGACFRWIRTDLGRAFTAEVIVELRALLGTSAQLGIAHRHECNSVNERTNREIGRHLRALVLDDRITKPRWGVFLPLVQRILNATPSVATGVAPARLLFGDAITLDRMILRDPLERPSAGTYEDYIRDLVATQSVLIEISQEFQARTLAKRVAKSPEVPTTFDVGAFVLMSHPEVIMPRAPKLAPRWLGPLVVTEVNGSKITVRSLVTRRTMSLHVSRLKAYDSSRTDDPLRVAVHDGEEFIVDRLLAHRGTTKRNSDFKVRWQGYEEADDTWEPYSGLKDNEALEDYLLAHPCLRDRFN